MKKEETERNAEVPQPWRRDAKSRSAISTSKPSVCVTLSFLASELSSPARGRGRSFMRHGNDGKLTCKKHKGGASEGCPCGLTRRAKGSATG